MIKLTLSLLLSILLVWSCKESPEPETSAPSSIPLGVISQNAIGFLPDSLIPDDWLTYLSSLTSPFSII